MLVNSAFPNFMNDLKHLPYIVLINSIQLIQHQLFPVQFIKIRIINVEFFLEYLKLEVTELVEL